MSRVLLLLVVVVVVVAFFSFNRRNSKTVRGIYKAETLRTMIARRYVAGLFRPTPEGA